MRAHAAMRIHRLRFLRVERRRIDADQLHAVRGEQVDGLGRDRAEVAVPLVDAGARTGAQQHARRYAVERGRDVGRLHDRRCADAMDHAARAEVGVEGHGADRRAVGVVVQRRVAMRARVRRQRQARDVDRRASLHPPHAFDGNRRIARPHGGGGADRRRDVPEGVHGMTIR